MLSIKWAASHCCSGLFDGLLPNPSQHRKRAYLLHRRQMCIKKVLNVTCSSWFLLFLSYCSETGSKINRKPASICLFDKVCRFQITVEIITTSRRTLGEMSLKHAFLLFCFTICLFVYFPDLFSWEVGWTAAAAYFHVESDFHICQE